MSRWRIHGVLLVVLFVGHLYLWVRVSELLGVAPSWSVAAGVLAVLALSGLGGLVVLRWRAFVVFRWARWFVSAWVGFFLYAVLLTVAGHVLDVLGGAAGLWGVEASWWTVGLPLLLAVVITVHGLVAAARSPGVQEIDVELRDLPASAEGLRVVHLSDVHLSLVLRVGSVRALVDRINELEPDLVVATGDLVDEVYDRCPLMGQFMDELARVRARLGKLAVLGNHEFRAARPRGAMAHLRRAGFVVLGNESVEPVAGLLVFGLHDISAHHTRYEELHTLPEQFPQILGQHAEPRTTILLYHQPLFVETFAGLGVDLMLAGHTHGGQLWPFGHWSKRTYRYLAGLFHVGSLTLHVSSGVGCAGPPLRVGAPRQITVLTLHRARK